MKALAVCAVLYAACCVGVWVLVRGGTYNPPRPTPPPAPDLGDVESDWDAIVADLRKEGNE